MEVVNVKLSEIKPYEKNPRKTDKAVDYVARSIEEFGFKVPIVIDEEKVIVAGHVRYRAAKKLKLKMVSVGFEARQGREGFFNVFLRRRVLNGI